MILQQSATRAIITMPIIVMFLLHLVHFAASWFSEVGLMIEFVFGGDLCIALYGTSDAGEVNIFVSSLPWPHVHRNCRSFGIVTGV